MEEIDNPHLHDPLRLRYLDRIKRCLDSTLEILPYPEKSTIGDFACAQGNIALSLAEQGYNVYAIDINPMFIEYSKKKYQKGKIKWIVSEIGKLDLPEGLLDAAIAGELIEHCAYPEEVIKKILTYVRVGGYLILTTPNGSRVGNKLPTFSEIIRKQDRINLERRQFGPAGKDHLFLFRKEEIGLILPKNAILERSNYCGGTLLFNKCTKIPMKAIPLSALDKISDFLMNIPYINRCISNNFCVIVRKIK